MYTADSALAMQLGAGPRAMRDSKLPKMGALAMMKTTDLFKNLSSALLHIGQLSGDPTSPLHSQTWPELLNTLEEVLQIYLILTAQDRPSSEKKTQVMGAYHLPNRLWRDLHWFLKRTGNLPGAFQLSVIAKFYHYLQYFTKPFHHIGHTGPDIFYSSLAQGRTLSLLVGNQHGLRWFSSGKMSATGWLKKAFLVCFATVKVEVGLPMGRR